MFKEREKELLEYENSLHILINKISETENKFIEQTINMIKEFVQGLDFNTSLIKVEFSNIVTLKIHYDRYKFTIGSENRISHIDNYNWVYEKRDEFYDYLSFLGIISRNLKVNDKFNSTIIGMFKELDILYDESRKIEKEIKKHKEETANLYELKEREVISSIIEPKMEFRFTHGVHISSIRNAIMIEIEDIKNKTYKCSVYGVNSNIKWSSAMWNSIYIKHTDLQDLLHRRHDSWNTDFNRKYNLEKLINSDDYE